MRASVDEQQTKPGLIGGIGVGVVNHIAMVDGCVARL